MESSDHGERGTATSAENQEDIVTNSPHYSRFQLWAGLAVAAMVVLGAAIDVFRTSKGNVSF